MSDGGGDTGGGDAEPVDTGVEVGEGDGEKTRDFDFTETEQIGYGSKLKESCSGVCIGFIIFFVSIALLVWNEGRTVKRARDLDEGREAVIELDLSQYDPSSGQVIPPEFENELIHTVGELSTEDDVYDPVFGVGGLGEDDLTPTTAPTTFNNGTRFLQGNTTEPTMAPTPSPMTASTPTTPTSTTPTTDDDDEKVLKLTRSVEMYQWVEKSTTSETKTSGGGTRRETKYTYQKQWSSFLVNSNNFKRPREETVNPTQFPFEPMTYEADPILLENVIELSPIVTNRINWYEPYSNVDLADVPDSKLRSSLTKYQNNGFYYGNGTSSVPQVGDTRITFLAVPPDTISIVAYVQTSSSGSSGSNYELDSYTTSRGGLLLLIQRGTHTANEMFDQADDENTALAWVLRFVGFFLMTVSITMMLQPLATAVDIIPFVGDCMQGGMEKCIFPTIALLISVPVSLFIIALSWIAYRPYIAIPVCAACLGLMLWLCLRGKKAVDENQNQQQNNQQGYPPQQGGYPPQQQGYNNQYPPQQQGGYPPQQQGGYPPQQGGYNNQYPPPQQQQQGGYNQYQQQQYGSAPPMAQAYTGTEPQQQAPGGGGFAGALNTEPDVKF